MIPRYIITAIPAAIITFGIFFVMQSLISRGSGGLGDVKGGRIVDFVRLERESELELKKRRLPNRKPPEEPPPPEFDLSDVPKPRHDNLSASAPVFIPEVALLGGPDLGAAPSDTDVVPLVRVNPQYPARAMQRGVEGWVLLEFTITKAGTVRDVVVKDADPPNYFERAAKKAVQKYKYKAKIEDGVPVERPGVQVVISFELED